MRQTLGWVRFLLITILLAPSFILYTPTAHAATVVNANTFPGGDVGAKINAADSSLGTQVGEIQVSGGGTISTRVVLSANHTLRFAAGTYTFVNEPILMREHTQVIGSGWDTILVEPTGNRWFVIASYNGTMAQGISGPIDEDQVVRDLQIKGANPNWDSAQSTIWFGNVHRAIVMNVWFNGTRANGVSAGGWGINGNYAEDVWLVNNKFTQVAAQEANGINARRMTIANNVFEKPGSLDGPFQAVIDMEPNVIEDKMEDIAILNNTLDSRGSARCNSSNFIVYQPFSGATTYTGGPAIIAGNTMTGLADNQSCTYSSNGIIITKASHDVQIFNNNLSGCGQNGLYIDGGTRISIYNNVVTNCGTGGIEAVRIGATDSNIFNNTITAPWGAANTQIVELSNASNNNYYNNGSGPYTLQSSSHQVNTAPVAPAMLKAGNPVISVASGQVTIASSTQYGETHYTTDGSEPTLLSPLYSVPFASSATIKAKVFRAGQYDSDVVTQTGNGSTPPPPPQMPTPPPPAPTPVPPTPTPPTPVPVPVPTPTPTPVPAPIVPSPVPTPSPVPASSTYAYVTNKLVNDGGTIYLINGYIKIPFTSMAAFKGLGYQLKYVVKGSAGQYKLPAGGYALSSASQSHAWGTWVKYGKTIFYVDSTGLIPVPTWPIFLSNMGKTEYILPANKADLDIFKANPSLPFLQMNDSRVIR